MEVERRRGCEAAIDILEAVRTFNAARPDGGIPIRIGLHFGEVFLGDVGAVDHYEYRAVGDVVNTASRIEQASKTLGTRLLISAAVLDGVDGLARRDLGLFQLAGKRNPIHLYELLGRRAACDEETTAFMSDFECALAAMQRGEWTQARDGFVALLARRPGDGPSRFFAAFCNGDIERPPPRDGRCIVQFDTK
jgi:adenylate cyclase